MGNDSVEQINRFTESIREEIDAPTELGRLGSRMFFMSEFNRAEEIFSTSLEATAKEDWTVLASLYDILGYVNYEKNNPSTALTHFKQSLSRLISLLSIIISMEFLMPKKNTPKHSQVISIHLKLNSITFLPHIHH